MANCNTCENQEKCSKLSPCIVEAYEQGRADREKELSELPNEYSEKLWKLAYNRGRADASFEEQYKQEWLTNHDKEIRADERAKTIDEFVGMIKDKWNKKYEDYKPCVPLLFLEDLEEWAEQMTNKDKWGI